MINLQQTIPTLMVSAIPMIFAITLHEAAHGYVARYFGDPTAAQMGRISLNPMRHIDPVGTLLIPSITVLFGGMFFGWAKPVPVDFNRLRHPRTDMRWVALAGPLANLLMALGWALLLNLMLSAGSYYTYSDFVTGMAKIGVTFNLVLMALNLLPILPLDGGRVLYSLLPPSMAQSYGRSEAYGLPILLFLVFTGALGLLITPLVNLGYYLIDILFLWIS